VQFAVPIRHSNQLQNVLKFLPMNRRHFGRTVVALAAAYAVALHAILIVFAGALGGATVFADQPTCAWAGGAGPGKAPDDNAPAGHGHDCLAACMTGCCAGPAAQGLGAAFIYAPRSAPIIVAVRDTAPAFRLSATGANRSRAPPLG